MEALLIHDMSYTQVFLEVAESWLSRQASVLNKPALWKKIFKKNSFWSCHCSELASFDLVFTALGLEIASFHLPHGKEEKMHLSICKKTFRNDGLYCSQKGSNGSQAGLPPWLYNCLVRGGCYGKTSVRARSCFHHLWMQITT